MNKIFSYSLYILMSNDRMQTTGISHLTKINFQIQINLWDRKH